MMKVVMTLAVIGASVMSFAATSPDQGTRLIRTPVPNSRPSLKSDAGEREVERPEDVGVKSPARERDPKTSIFTYSDANTDPDRRKRRANSTGTVTTEFAEVEIQLNGKVSLQQVRSLPLAPDSPLRKLSNPARVVVQLPRDTAIRLAKQGVKIRTIRQFMLVEPAPIEEGEDGGGARGACSGDYRNGTNPSPVYIPDEGGWVYSQISISGASGQTVSCIDVHYEITHPYIEDLDVDLNDADLTYNHNLWGPGQGLGEDLSETVTGITTFNGELVNQTWRLWVQDVDYYGDGYIELWWIKVYYGGGGGLPDLEVYSSSLSPATGVHPGDLIHLEDTVVNWGTAATTTPFYDTWFISTDTNVTTSDFEWAWYQMACCLAPNYGGGGVGDMAWPDVSPYNTPGQTYYVALIADDLNDVRESDETNNRGTVWPVQLAGAVGGCPGSGDCCLDNGTTGCENQSCCETVCVSDSSCCSSGWDSQCANLAASLCGELCVSDGSCPGPGDCCGPNGTGSCQDGTCCETVCDVDGYCCNTVWDSICAGLAEQLCGNTCPGYDVDSFEPDNFPANATSVSCGDQQTHTIPTDGDVDWYSISLDTGDELTIETSNLTGSNPDTLIELFSSACGFIASDDDGGVQFASRLSWTATVSGLHYVKIFAYDYNTEDPVLGDCSNQGGGPSSCQYDVTFTCDRCTPPPAPFDPLPPDQATEVPLDTQLCWNGQAQIAKVIYGADDRLDVYEVFNPDLLAAADATVAVVDTANLIDNGNGNYSLPPHYTFSEIIPLMPWNTQQLPLCPAEPYGDQPAPAFCSGFLVAPDMIATAGHCIDSADCSTTAFVFNFDMSDHTTPILAHPASDVYFCSSVVGREINGSTGADWAVVRLDRAVVGHTPVPIRRSGTVSNGESLVLIGHPMGIPTKIAGGATVRNNSQLAFFDANVDAYAGNSGSAVFNATTLEVEGVLVRGNADFVINGSCIASYQCQDSGCPGWEAATRVTEFADLIPAMATTEYEILFEDCDGVAAAMTATTSETCWTPPVSLDGATSYCWQVTARDGCDETVGPPWSFTTTCGAALNQAVPGHNESLWRSQDNVVQLTFDRNVTAPAEGELLIRELRDDGGFGSDLSPFFTFTVLQDTLTIRENGAVLNHRRWYAISSRGWGSACDFDLHYVLQVGDASNDGRVLAFDVSAMRQGFPCPVCPDDRRDINGDNQVNATDLETAEARMPSFTVPKPTGH